MSDKEKITLLENLVEELNDRCKYEIMYHRRYKKGLYIGAVIVSILFVIRDVIVHAL